jgi:uncharacterized integral membrane protein
MKVLYWLVAAPLMLLAVLFAVTNRDVIELGLWPLPWVVSAPVYVIALIALAVGFLAGAIVVWISGGKRRGRARAAERKILDQAREISELRRRLEAAEAAQAGPTAEGGEPRPALTGRR